MFINLYLIFSFFLYLTVLNTFYTTNDIRKKFLFFVVNLFIIVGVGLYYSLDGLVMLFFISELSILLIFITMFSQLYTYKKTKFIVNKFTCVIPCILLFLNINYYDVNLLQYTSYYNTTSVLINDFYYVYNCYFEKQILLTLFSIFIITVYSVFFILLYFVLKSTSVLEQKKKKNLYLLRKQNLLHQNNYNTKIRIFKKKNKCFKKTLFQYLVILVVFF